MDIKDILNKVDHTCLNVTATEQDITALCEEAKKYKTASVCIPPCYVKFAKEYLKNNVKICTVIGFPNGYSTAQVKAFETADAVKNGADEIDMVINIGFLKDKRYDKIKEEIKQIKDACGEKTLKVIIETCFLTEKEKIKMCEIVSECGADFIKTSTGFGNGGATLDDIKLFKNHIGQNVGIKAAGGIKSIEDAKEFLNAGASRLGTSRIVKALKEKGE